MCVCVRLCVCICVCVRLCTCAHTARCVSVECISIPCKYVCTYIHYIIFMSSAIIINFIQLHINSDICNYIAVA